MTTATKPDAKEFQSKLAQIAPQYVPVLCRDRCIPRKEQAALARKLFKQLGLKGISVTTPNYSMASCVDVTIPRRDDFTRDERGEIDYRNDPVCIANNEAQKRVEAILLAAFPNHNDRSDYMTDYFDSKWSIS